MKTPPFQIQFGAISPAIKTQIKSQGLTAQVIDIAQWQRLADAITLLKIQGMITGTADHCGEASLDSKDG